jgi:hypothetical protein
MKKLKEFDDHYDVATRFRNTETGSDGVFETYGKDLERIRKMMQKNPKRVWTTMDSEISDDVIIVPEMRFVNRINYVISKQPWKSTREVYKW